MRTLLIGLVPTRQDDRVASRVLDAIDTDRLEGVEVVRWTAAPRDLAAGTAWHEADVTVVVGTLRTGAPVGTIHEIVVDGTTGPPIQVAPKSGALAVVLAAAIERGQLPRRLVMLGIEPGAAIGRSGSADVPDGTLKRVLALVEAELGLGTPTR